MAWCLYLLFSIVIFMVIEILVVLVVFDIGIIL
jgi:hypothetical protein